MNKILRFTFVAAMVLTSICGFSKTVTIDFNANGLKMFDGITAVSSSSTTAGDFTEDKTATVDGVTLTVSKSTSTTANRMWGTNAGPQLRIYGGTLKISSSQKITKIVFDKGTKWQGVTASPETLTDATWTNSGANEVTFTVTAAKGNQIQINKIEITLADESGDNLAAPTISGNTSFTESATVTITAADGATIYYTTNGQEPDDREGTQYTAPFTISETTTVKAIAYKGDLESSIATQEFTKKEIKAASDIGAFNSLADKDEAVLTLNNAKVLYSWTSNNNNNSTYIRDASGALCLYNAGLDLKAGQILNGTVNITRSSYNGTIQGAKNDKTSKTTFTATDGEAPIANTIKPADAASHVSDLVQFTNVNIVKDNTRFYIVDGDNKVQVYNGFHINGYTVAAAENVDVKGILVKYNTTYEVYPIEVPVTTGITEIKADKAVLDANAPMYNLAGQRVDKSFKGIVIQKGKEFLNK